MISTVFFERIRFLILLAVSCGIVLSFFALSYGCKEKKPVKQQPLYEVTLENLQTAYEKSLKHQSMYLLFVRQAEKEKKKQIAELYRALARSEEIHAKNHAALMSSKGISPRQPIIDSIVVGNVIQTLKMAQSSEEIESESMYPNLIRSAEQEKFAEAVDQFRITMDADMRHLELIKEAHDKGGKIQKVPYYVCSICGYILTTDKVEECPNCKAAKNQFEKIP